MPSWLIHNATLLVTMDASRREIEDGCVFVRDRRIVAIGTGDEFIQAHIDDADRLYNARGMLLFPGLVNCHHHLYQTLTRAVPAAQDVSLFGWLKTLYPIWANLTGEAVYVSALVGLIELLFSGCTTVADHLYIYPNDATIDEEIRAAREVGVRFHPTRGSMSLGESEGGLPPDSVTEDEETILRETRRAIEEYHDPSPYSMCRVGVAPCSPFSVTPELMRESIELARSYGVLAHTHLAETRDEEEFCLERFGRRPVEYAEDLGWVGDDVWWAHAVHVDADEIQTMARTGTGMAHCPSSNMRLASGIAPVRAMLDADVRVGLGVDGSASNDSSHMLAEARQALLLQRVQNAPDALSARETLEVATLGGARVLQRDDIGAIAVGKAADIVGMRLDHLDYAGAVPHDPVAALVFCYPRRVDFAMVNGRLLVDHGDLLGWDLGRVVDHHNRTARALVVGD